MVVSPDASYAVIQDNLHAHPEWEHTLKHAIHSIVSISVTQTRAFDTEQANVSEASGFLVDAELGLILTNRHVVTPGPVTADVTLWNHEEIPARPIYRDPVHDFGFYRIDPGRVKYASDTFAP